MAFSDANFSETFFKIGEIRAPTQEDFQYVKNLTNDNKDWTTKYEKNGMVVSVKDTEIKDMKIYKIHTHFDGIDGAVMYDLVHDDQYRRQWDEAVISDVNICRLENSSSDIGYYSMRCPIPLKNRDFLNQRCWRALDDEYIVFSHSVAHEKYPPFPQFIRGITYVTAYYIRKSSTGCYITYMTQSDLRGHIPKWILNLVTTKVAPRILLKLRKAAESYTEWKSHHDPGHKPWLYPEQSSVPEVSIESLQSFDEVPLSPLPVELKQSSRNRSQEDNDNGITEEEEEEVPAGMPIDPLLVGDNGIENGHC